MLKTTNDRTSAQKGFTIIEVLIVLAIAGLILLIVFLAVPALQRNANNTAIKNDAAGLLGGMAEYVSNNNGKTPTAASGGTDNSVKIGVAPLNTVDVKLGYVSGTAVSITPLTGTQAAPAEGIVKLYTNAVCDTAGTGATATGATTRNYVALYTLVGGARQCQAS